MFSSQYEVHSPAFVFKGAPANNQALMTMMGIINTVYLPRGEADREGGRVAKRERGGDSLTATVPAARHGVRRLWGRTLSAS